MRERMKMAQLTGTIHATSDFSYRNRRLVGPRLMRVGDAAGFMDPIFSSGVFLAMFSGKLAAEVVHQSQTANDDGKGRMVVYEKRFNAAMRFYWEMVENFYTTPFMEIFLEPREKFDLPAVVNAFLAGELEGGWSMRWRLRLFFLIVKLQARWPLVPRISFSCASEAHVFCVAAAGSNADLISVPGVVASAVGFGSSFFSSIKSLRTFKMDSMFHEGTR